MSLIHQNFTFVIFWLRNQRSNNILKDLSRTQVTMHKCCAYRNEATWRRFWRKRKSTVGGFATVQFFPCTWKIYSVGMDQFINCEFCILKIRPIVSFCSDSTHVFISSASTHLTILNQGCRSFYFPLLIKLTFLVSEGLLC